MKILLLYTDSGDLFGYLIVLVIAFIFGVLITRWIFRIDKIIAALEMQNKYGQAQIRLLIKMLLNQGTSKEEIDRIVEKGNLKNEDGDKS